MAVSSGLTFGGEVERTRGGDARRERVRRRRERDGLARDRLHPGEREQSEASDERRGADAGWTPQLTLDSAWPGFLWLVGTL